MKLVRTATAFLGHFRSLGVINWVERERQSAWWLRGNRYFWECIASWHACLGRLFQSSMVHFSSCCGEFKLEIYWPRADQCKLIQLSCSITNIFSKYELQGWGSIVLLESANRNPELVNITSRNLMICPIGFSTLAWSRGLALSEYWGSKLHR